MTADPGQQAGLRIGVVLEAFLDWPLEQVMSWLQRAAPEVTDLEIGAGGYAPHPHCDVDGLLRDGQARAAWLARIGGHRLRVDALARALGGSQALVVSIEHEDPFVPATTGVPEAARLLRAAIDAALEPA